MSNEILTIRLGHRKGDIDYAGWVEGMTEDEAWRAGRGWWVLKASRAIECSLAVILNPACEVIAEAEILGIHRDSPDSDRFEILGKLRTEGHEYLGTTAERGTSQNPIAYLKPSEFVFSNADSLPNAHKFTWDAGDLKVVSKGENPLEAMAQFQKSILHAEQTDHGERDGAGRDDGDR